MSGTATADPGSSTSGQPAGGGLKEQWGLNDPQLGEIGSSEQAKKFADSFKEAMEPVNKCLQYTVVNAEKAKHDSFVAERDKSYSDFQEAQKKIDPADESKAKDDIEAVLKAAEELSTKTTQFKEATERAVNAWKPKEPEFEKAVTQVEEMEQWGYKQAPELRTSANGIRSDVNERRFEEAVQKFDQLAANLKPAYEDYLRQKEAQPKYEAALQAVEPRLSQTANCPFKKLAPTQEEIGTVRKQMESSAQEKDYIQALQTASELTAKVDAYLAAVAELERQKAEYEKALEAAKPKLDEAGQKTVYNKLAPQKQEYESLKTEMESAAQAEDYEQALAKVTDLTTKVDAYIQAVNDLEAKKKEYETALEAVKPKLDEAGQKTVYNKLAPQKQEYESLKTEMESAAQAEDYEQALAKVTDLTTKVDTYIQAVNDLEAKKKEYEAALEAAKPKLDEAGQKTVYQKLSQQKTDYESVKGEMESAAQGEDYEQALAKVTDLTTKLDAYIQAVNDLEAKKKEYETALEAVKPKLDEAGQKTVYNKLAPQKQEFESLKTEMESAAQGEDYEQALAKVTDLTTKVDAYIQAVNDLEAKKKEYETALEAVKPKLEEAGQKTVYNKLAPQKQEFDSLKGEMESAATGEDYEQALQKVTDLTTKVDAYIQAVNDLEAKKKEYETALEAVKPKLDEASQKTVYNKLAPQKQEFESLKTEMESAAQGEDYEQALAKVSDLTTKVDAYIQAVNDLEAKKKEYETALEAVKPKLDEAGQKTVYNKLAPQKQEYESLKTEMESAAQAEDYEQALAKVTDLTTKVDAYIQAVNDLEAKKKEYETALEAVKPKLDEAGQKTVYQKLSQQKTDYESVKGEMETAAQGEDYEQALAKVNDLTTKVDAYIQAVNDLEAKKKEYEAALEAVKPKLDEAGQKTVYNKLAPQKQEFDSLKGEMESAAQGEDYEQALAKVTDLTTKVDAYIQAVNDLEAKKKEYETALEAVKPKLDEAGQKTCAKLDPQKQEYESVKAEMETAAQGEDFEQALAKVNDLTTKVDAYLQAVKDLDEKKQQYEQALEAVKPKLEEAGQKTCAKLDPQKQEYESVKAEMETAAQGEDYEQALAKVTDLTTKLDAYIQAVNDLEAKKKEYETALEAVKPKLDEAGQKTVYTKLEPMKQEYETLKTEMESAAQAEDYDAALTKATDLSTKLDAYLAAVKDLEEKKQKYEQALPTIQEKLKSVGETSSPELAPKKQEIDDLKSQMESAAQTEDYETALTKQNDLGPKIDAYKADSDPKKAGPGSDDKPVQQPDAKGTLKVNYVRMSKSSEKIEESNIFQFDYGLTNDGDEPTNDWFLDWAVFDSSDREIKKVDSTLPGSIKPKETVDWCHMESDAHLGVGKHRVHVRFHSEKATLHEEDLFFERAGIKPTESKGTIKVNYVRMSKTSEKIEESTIFQFDYGLTNEGDEPAKDWFLDWTVFDPSGKELKRSDSTLPGSIKPKETVDWCHMESDAHLGVGKHRVHVRFHSEKATLHEEDLFFERAGIKPTESKGTIKVNYVRMSKTSEKIEESTIFQFDYGLTNEGDEPAKDWFLDWTVFDPSGKELKRSDSTLPGSIKPKETVDWCHMESDAHLGVGKHRVHVRFHSEKATLHEEDLFFERAGIKPTESKGTIKVNYVRMSKSSETVVTQGIFQFDYGLTNEGDEPAKDWFLDWTVFDPSGKELKRSDSTLPGSIKPKETVDWCHMESDAHLGVGKHRVHVRFHSEKATLHEEDLFFEVVARPSGHADSPTVNDVSPKESPAQGGIPVTITGTGFKTAIAVHFNELRAQFKIDSDTQITATTPSIEGSYSPGSGLLVTVTTPVGKSSEANSQPHVTFVAPAETPSAPKSGEPSAQETSAPRGIPDVDLSKKPSNTPQLSLNHLSQDQKDAAQRFLSDHKFGAALTASGADGRSGSRTGETPDDYEPTLDGKNTTNDQVVDAMKTEIQALPLQDPTAELKELVNNRFLEIVGPMIKHASEEAAKKNQLPPSKDGPGSGVPRDLAKGPLTDFFERVQNAQGGSALKVTDIVHTGGLKLSEGLGDSFTQIDNYLKSKKNSLVEPADLAQEIINRLPASIPQANVDALERLAIKETKSTEPQTISDVLDGFVDKQVDTLFKGASKDVRDIVKKLVKAALKAGATTLAKNVMEEKGLGVDAQENVLKVLEAATKQKANERSQELKPGEGSNPSKREPAPPKPVDPPDIPDVHDGPNLEGELPEGPGSKPTQPQPAGKLRTTIENTETTDAIVLTVNDMQTLKTIVNHQRVEPKQKVPITIKADSFDRGTVRWWALKVGEADSVPRPGTEVRITVDGQKIPVGL